ncbi:uncharacterized protein N7459_004490 [Penicillium hispanicum]|uniref:uncharacterized protein n=1 Tax=Penicillium hispanicum TaxID=1080232 RepID=UPI0025420C5D|nr:uncharacterized protein N7459_004490 [Penicillium hispanicum]KAJ5584690.1 hypothetical protein N7459_004490 [Penicillium hispanicum]
MDSTDRTSQGELGASQMVVQQYARYPPTLESTLQSASSLGSGRSQLDPNRSPSLHRKDTPRSLQSSPKGVRSTIPPPSAARSGPSMSPPVFDALRHQQMKDAADQAESRALPSRDITDESIDDAYVVFILYCNPNVPSSVDTSELRKTFRCPPRSDGKNFSVFTLFELIRKLDNKELKTWIQLAIELGVEPPSMEKKQSTQKVQQYSVRLKRWMRAMHVDSFFEYCLGHPHPYYTQLPPSGPFVSESRDGVPLEEDLALRALVPEWKPKRGRKRADEREFEEEKPAKRPSLDTSAAGLQKGAFQNHGVTFPPSAIPFSAFPDDDPWITASSSFPPPGTSDQQGQELRWRLPERETTPAGYPQSAIIPRGNQPPEFIMSAEPRSAVTPSSGEKSRAKRRHGPAVSSAWPNSNGSASGKNRGRPPNKSSSGSFSTFQVTPSRESSQFPPHSIPQSSPLVVDHNHSHAVLNAPHGQSPTPGTHGRPEKLQLQVPQHMGAPVRLATPPTLLVNGVNGAVVSRAEGNQELHLAENSRSLGSSQMGKGQDVPNPPSKITMDDIVHAMTGELMRARLVGQPTPLRPDEAHSLASAIVVNLSSWHSQLPVELHSILMAFHLGIAHQFGLTASRSASTTVNVEQPVTSSNRADQPPGSEAPANGVRYSVNFEYQPSGRFSMQIVLGPFGQGFTAADGSHHPVQVTEKQPESTELATYELEEDNLDDSAPDATWKQRYLKLRAQVQKKDRALSQYKRKIVESVMADI